MKTREPQKHMTNVMRAIEKWFALYRKAPSIHEIMAETGLTSTNHVWYYLNKLEKEGYITREKETGYYQGRKIRLTRKRMFM